MEFKFISILPSWYFRVKTYSTIQKDTFAFFYQSLSNFLWRNLKRPFISLHQRLQQLHIRLLTFQQKSISEALPSYFWRRLVSQTRNYLHFCKKLKTGAPVFSLVLLLKAISINIYTAFRSKTKLKTGAAGAGVNFWQKWRWFLVSCTNIHWK